MLQPLISVIGLLLISRGLSQEYDLKGSKTIKTYNCYGGYYCYSIVLEVSTSSNIARITMTGRSEDWIGFGWNSTRMNDTYAIIADGDTYATSIVSEWKLGFGERGTQLKITVSVQNNSVSNQVRTVIVLRNVTISGRDYYDFPTKPTDIPIIWGYGMDFEPRYAIADMMGGLGATDLNLKDA
eukprot:335631_1